MLTLMGVAAAVVSPMLSPPSTRSGSATDAVVADARALAIMRAEPLRLDISGGGAWNLRSVRGGGVLDSGMVESPAYALAVVVDALGRCMPDAQTVTAAAFDPLSCVFVPTVNSP